MNEDRSPAPKSEGPSTRGPDRAEPIVLGCCALAMVLCFAPWYTMEMSSELGGLSGRGSAQGFDSWHGVLVFLLCAASGAAVWMEKSGAVQLDRRTARLAALAGCGLAWLITVIYVASVDDASLLGMRSGKTLWPYVVLVATGVATYFAFARFGALPAPGAGSAESSDRAS